MRITNIIAVILTIISLVAFCVFLFYPYSELSSIQDKRDIAVNCLYTVIASAIGLVATAIADRN